MYNFSFFLFFFYFCPYYEFFSMSAAGNAGDKYEVFGPLLTPGYADFKGLFHTI